VNDVLNSGSNLDSPETALVGSSSDLKKIVNWIDVTPMSETT